MACLPQAKGEVGVELDAYRPAARCWKGVTVTSATAISGSAWLAGAREALVKAAGEEESGATHEERANIDAYRVHDDSSAPMRWVGKGPRMALRTSHKHEPSAHCITVRHAVAWHARRDGPARWYAPGHTLRSLAQRHLVEAHLPSEQRESREGREETETRLQPLSALRETMVALQQE